MKSADLPGGGKSDLPGGGRLPLWLCVHRSFVLVGAGGLQ